jgi:hypothetical protein
MRSAKRDQAARPAKGPARTAQAGAAPGAQAPPAAKAAGPQAKQAPRRPRSRPVPPPPTPPASGAPNPLGDVVRTGAKVAEAGVKAGVGLTRGVLRRLPRP